ncbi:MAG: hypothetical protein QXT31_05040 [Candidatus Bathyarchaeia archaeon]
MYNPLHSSMPFNFATTATLNEIVEKIDIKFFGFIIAQFLGIMEK